MATSELSHDERLDLIAGVIYADVFDCAVTFDELWHYAHLRVGRDELRDRLENDRSLRELVTERDGLYCLSGHEALLDVRSERRRRARVLQRRARRVARLIGHAPFVRGLLLTGSAAADNAINGADVDMLVIVADGRLSLVFTLFGSLSRLLSRRTFCPNYYVSERHLDAVGRNIYVAHEIVQAHPLAGRAGALRAANGWVCSVLPNAEDASTAPLRGGGLAQRMLEWPLRGRLGDRLDRSLRRLTLARLGAHHSASGSAVPRAVMETLAAGIELRFHGIPAHQSILARYEARRNKLASQMTGARFTARTDAERVA